MRHALMPLRGVIRCRYDEDAYAAYAAAAFSLCRCRYYLLRHCWHIHAAFATARVDVISRCCHAMPLFVAATPPLMSRKRHAAKIFMLFLRADAVFAALAMPPLMPLLRCYAMLSYLMPTMPAFADAIDADSQLSAEHCQDIRRRATLMPRLHAAIIDTPIARRYAATPYAVAYARRALLRAA